MRALNPEERKKLNHLVNNLPTLIAEMEPCVMELAETIGTPNPEKDINDISLLAIHLDHFTGLEDLTVWSKEDKVWILTRIMYAVARFLMRTYGGRWAVQSDPEKEFFLRYVVTDFNEQVIPNLFVEPVGIAWHYLNSEPTRSFVHTIQVLEENILITLPAIR